MRYLKIGLLAFVGFSLSAQEMTPEQLIRNSEKVLRGVESSESQIRMTIQRPKYTREMELKTWTKTEQYALIYIADPARDKGTTFLKKDKEIWNWVPSIEKVIKLPPSMMMQSWMGSDFTNDDLVKQSSIIEDYTQKIIGEENINGKDCYQLELIPKPDAPVVWGRVVIWIDKVDYLQMKVSFYDEDEYLINSMLVTEIQELDGRLLPRKVELTPEEEPENKTIIEYLDLKFDQPIDEDFFTVQNMKRIRL